MGWLWHDLHRSPNQNYFVAQVAVMGAGYVVVALVMIMAAIAFSQPDWALRGLALPTGFVVAAAIMFAVGGEQLGARSKAKVGQRLERHGRRISG